jgi:hypothetical protein
MSHLFMGPTINTAGMSPGRSLIDVGASLAHFITQMDAAVKTAAAGAGQSDVLFESRLQAVYAGILAAAPAELKPQVEAELLERGYEPDFTPYQAGPGECSLTGIATDCCPCGQHE